MKVFLYILIVGETFSMPIRVPVADWSSCLRLLETSKHKAAETDTVVMFCGGPDMEYRPHGDSSNPWKKVPDGQFTNKEEK